MKNEIFEVTLVWDITTAQETLRISYADANALSSVRILLIPLSQYGRWLKKLYML